MRETLLSLELPRDRTEVKRPRPACKWQEVPGDVIKINLDGAIQISSEIAGTRIIARERSSFRGTSCKTYEGVRKTIEALALGDAVLYAVSRGIERVVFEVDCAVLVRHWQDRNIDRSLIGLILEETSEHSTIFQSFSIAHVRCEANMAAHCCAKFCVYTGRVSVMGCRASRLEHSLLADCKFVIHISIFE